jgi:hypothetical protein
MSEDFEKGAKDSLALSIIVVAGVSLLLWKFPEIYQGPWWMLKWLEVEFILTLRDLFSPEYVDAAYKIKQLLAKYPVGDYNFTGMVKTDQYTQWMTGWVFNAVLFIIGLRIVRRNAEKFNKRHDLESLLEVTSRHWRFNRYLLTHNPSKDTKLDLGCKTSNYRVRDKPIEYLTEKGILTLVGKKYKINRLKLIDDSTEVLGEHYTGIDSFNRDELVVFAGLAMIVSGRPYIGGLKEIFLDNFGQNRFLKKWDITNNYIKNWSKTPVQVAVELFGDMSECYNNERKFADVEDLARIIALQALESTEIQKICSQHCFKSTLIRRMQFEARASSGVLPSSYFGWIAVNHRTFFVSMSDEGMSESSAEAYAIKNHLMLEMLMEKPVYDVNVDRHIKWIDYYLHQKNYTELVD